MKVQIRVKAGDKITFIFQEEVGEVLSSKIGRVRVDTSCSKVCLGEEIRKDGNKV